MGGEDHIVQIAQRAISRQGFLLEDVEHRAADMIFLQYLDNGILLDHRPTRGVDQQAIRLE